MHQESQFSENLCVCHKTVDKSGPQRVLNILRSKYTKNINKTALESHDNRLSNKFLCTLCDSVIEEIITIQVEVSNLINSFMGHCISRICRTWMTTGTN